MFGMCLVSALILGAGAPPAIERDGMRISGIAPTPGQRGHLGFVFEADWLEGRVELRCPETLNTSLGLHFIDHHRDDMPQLSELPEPVAWRADPARGTLTYSVTTREGVSFDATATAAPDGAWLDSGVRNGTKDTLHFVSCQMCLDLSGAPALGQRHRLATSCTWVEGARQSLAETTPTAEQKGRKPWVLMQTRGLAGNYGGPMEWPDGWWVVDQVADLPLLLREVEPGPGLAGVAWDDDAAMLMSNTNIPCLHAGPNTPFDLAPGERKGWRGKVYLTQNSVEATRAQYDIDRAEGFLRHDLVVRRPGAGPVSEDGPTVRVAAVRVTWQQGVEPPEDVLARGFALAAEAAEQGAKLIVLPENFLHSENPEDQVVPAGALVRRAEAFAKEHGVWLCAGMIESAKFDWRDTWDRYLSAVVVGPAGYVSRHRKVDVNVLPYNRNWREGAPKTDMGAWAGGDFAMHAAGPVDRLGIMICRDTNSSWAWTRVLTQNPRLIASPNLRDSVAKYGADFGAMAAKAGVPIVVACGDPQSESFILNRRGEVVAFLKDGEGVMVADVALAPEDPSLRTFDVIHNSFVVTPEF